MQYLQNQSYPLLIKYIVFLDGYSSQFKCGRFLFYVARIHHWPRVKNYLLEHAWSGIILVVDTIKEGGMELEPL